MINTDILDEFKEFLEEKEKAKKEETPKEKIEKAGNIPFEDFKRIAKDCSITITGGEFAETVSKMMEDALKEHDIEMMFNVSQGCAALMGELFGEKIYEQYLKEQKEEK